MQIKAEIKKVTFQGVFNEDVVSTTSKKIFKCKLKVEFVDSISDSFIWADNLDLIDMQKVWLVGRSKTDAFLMLKDDSKAIADLALALTKMFTDEWPQICLAGTPIFHDFVASRNFLIDSIKDDLNKETLELHKTDTSEVDTQK